MRRIGLSLAAVCALAFCLLFASCAFFPSPSKGEGTTDTPPILTVPEETTPEETTPEETTPEETTPAETAPAVTEPDFSNPPDPDGTKRY